MCCCMIQSHRPASSRRQIAINRAADKIEDAICLLRDADVLLAVHLTPLEYWSVHDIGAATRQAIIGLDALDEIRHPSRTED